MVSKQIFKERIILSTRNRSELEQIVNTYVENGWQVIGRIRQENGNVFKIDVIKTEDTQPIEIIKEVEVPVEVPVEVIKEVEVPVEVIKEVEVPVEVEKIVEVPADPNLQDKTIIENGEYTADEGYDGFGSVVVNVPEVIREVPVEVPIEVPVDPVLQDKNIVENGTYIADEGYDGLGTISVEVPKKISFGNTNSDNKVIEIPDWCFYNQNIDELYISKSVSSIGARAFSNTGIKKIVFEEGSKLEEIKSYAFYNSNLTSLDLSECKKLKWIKSQAFMGSDYFHNNMESIILPETDEELYIDGWSFGPWWIKTVSPEEYKPVLETLIVPENVRFTTEKVSHQGLNGPAFLCYTIRNIIFKCKTPEVYTNKLIKLGDNIFVPYSDDHSIIEGYKSLWPDNSDTIFESDPE